MMSTKEKNFWLCVLLGLIAVLLAIFSPTNPTPKEDKDKECMLDNFTYCKVHTDGTNDECKLAAAALCSGMVK
jgi:hypothetical protein